MSLGGQERFCMVVVHEVVSIIKRGGGYTEGQHT